MDAAFPSDLATIARIVQNGLYWQAAATTVVLYDHASTLDLEVELIWKRKLSLVQVLYFVNRYAGDVLFLHGTAYQVWLTGDAYEEGCKTGGYVQMSMSLIGLYAMQGIIINRIWCMYRRSKVILWIMLSAFLIEITSSMVLIGLDPEMKAAVMPFSPTLVACIPLNLPKFSWVFWVSVTIFDLLVFLLALVEGIRYFRGRRRSRPTHSLRPSILASVMQSGFGGDIFRVLFRDSILFPFLGVIFGALAFLSIFQVLPFGSGQATILVACAGTPILGSRLILNLRDAYHQPFAEEVKPSSRRSNSHFHAPHPSEITLEFALQPSSFAQSRQSSKDPSSIHTTQ